MNIELKFDYYSKIVFIPDGYVSSIEKLKLSFLDWVERNPNCILIDPNRSIVLSYNENDFILFLNTEVLKNSNEKAYFLKENKCSKIHGLIEF